VERPQNRKICEVTTEELEAAAAEPREKIGKLSEGERGFVQDAVTKSVN
jgi:hypothetical protein